MGTIFDQETKANRLPVADESRVIRLSGRRDIEDDLLALARTVRVEREDEIADHEEDDFEPNLYLIDGEGQTEDIEKAAAIKMSIAAGVFSVVAIGQAIVNGPIPFK